MPGPPHLPRPFAAPPQRDRARTPGKGTGRPTPSLFIPGVPRRTPLLARAATPPAPSASVPEPAAPAPAEPSASSEEAWLTEIAQEPDWTLHTPSAAHSVTEGGESDAELDSDGVDVVAAEPTSAPAAIDSPPDASDFRTQELEDALQWDDAGESEPAAEAARPTEIDESTWPYLDLPVDEFGFPILPEGLEALFARQQGAHPTSEGLSDSDVATRTASLGDDPERIARVLHALAERVRAGAIRLPGEVDRGDEAVVLAATLTALLSRNRE